MNPNNILDAEGIKKITDLTARQQVLANDIRREKEKTITKQDVEAREAILELERQQSEAEEKQAREVAEIKARERSEAEIVAHQQRQRSEQARISSDEEIQIADENRMRQVLVAEKSKQRTDAVETERVEKDRALEATERERIVTLAKIEKDKAVELEKKNIQDVIRDRVIVERAVVEEEEKIKDAREFAEAERQKRVAILAAEKEAEQGLVKTVKEAEASKKAADLMAEERVIEADAGRSAAERETDAKKMLAEAITAEAAASGLAEAQVINAKAEAIERQGNAEAHVMKAKAQAEADGITQKAEAMKLFDGVGRDHEEFKLRLNKDKDIELEALNVQARIAEQQALLVGEGLKSANIDIVGGDMNFFDKIVNAIGNGKVIDRTVDNSKVLTDVRSAFFGEDGSDLAERLQLLAKQIGLDTEDVKNLSVAALIARLMSQTSNSNLLEELEKMLGFVKRNGMADQQAANLLQLDAASE